MKRFYKFVTVDQEQGGYAIQLDGKPIKTPSGQKLLAPNAALAQEIQKEWAAQEGVIAPQTMPLTQILTTKIDQVTSNRAAMTKEILKFLDTDLIFYYAPDLPEGLVQRQREHWDRWHKWFEKLSGAAILSTQSLQALIQPKQAHAAAEKKCDAYDEDHFTILQLTTALTGSLVLAMAFTDQQLSAHALYAAIRVEETFKAEIYNEQFYGPDPAQKKKEESIKADLSAAAHYLELVNSN